MTAKKYLQVTITSLATFLVMANSSCVRKELPAIVKKGKNTSSVDLGEKYTRQCYFSLKNNTMVSSNTRQQWSLAFETAQDGFHVILNSSRNMFVYPTTKTDFTSVKFSDRGEACWDRSCGSMDSTAIGDWRTSSYVYIIDEGGDDNDVNQGWSKIQVLSVNATSYKIRVSKINNSNDVTLVVPKDTTCNYSYILIGNDPKVVTIEPPKDTWDIMLTRYAHTFFDPFTSYLVVGCISNRYNTLVAEDSTTDFEKINMEMAKTYTFSTDVDAIGYDWKQVGSTNGGGTDYKVNPNKIYIIKTAHDEYYKLHFVDFYNDKLQKGAPKWEYQRL